MPGQLALVLHAHLPFVRHPEHEKFLEESWLFEAITESYIPLLRVLEGWRRDGLAARLTLTLSPTLCGMLRDPLLQSRYTRHLESLIELTEKEHHRTQFEHAFYKLARMYHKRFNAVRETWSACSGDLVSEFRKFQETGVLEIMTCAATHALLPLLANHPPSLRAQILIARDDYLACFGREPRGIWLPECAYTETVEPFLQEANLRWFILDTHGLMHAQPLPRYGVFAPVFTPRGLAAFARDVESARQVWSRHEGYPGDPNYRDFYRDIGYDLDFDYVKPHLPSPDHRGFTGVKYYRITGASTEKQPYDHAAALRQADAHAAYFLGERVRQFGRLAGAMDRAPLVVMPYDAELFGHWWYEGQEFLDLFVRKAVFDQRAFTLTTPQQYLRDNPTQQVATPAASTWGEHGHLGVWLNEKNEWILPHLQVAQTRMTELARRFAQPTALETRALRQAARELLLAQASDWPFILRAGTSPDYARRRVKDHLLQFNTLFEQLTSLTLDEAWLGKVEGADNIFPEVNFRYWI